MIGAWRISGGDDGRRTGPGPHGSDDLRVPDREKLLHGLVTHDVGAPGNGLVWSALLTAQGKYLADFFLLNRGEDILLDVKTDLAPGLAQKLRCTSCAPMWRSPTAG
jgi:glycine cleavage system aminomethyltransferase T